MDIKTPTYLAVWFKEPREIREYATPNRMYTFTPGKTIYVTIDPTSKEIIRPAGRSGISNATETNLSLSNNISSKDIKQLTLEEARNILYLVR